jgi:hypothetical protein
MALATLWAALAERKRRADARRDATEAFAPTTVHPSAVDPFVPVVSTTVDPWDESTTPLQDRGPVEPARHGAGITWS